MTSSVLTKITLCFCSEHEPNVVQPETREAWRDLATQQWLRGVEVIKCLDYITTMNSSLHRYFKFPCGVNNKSLHLNKSLDKFRVAVSQFIQ